MFLDLSEGQIEDIIQLDPTRIEVVVCDFNSPVGRSGLLTRILTHDCAHDEPNVQVMVARDTDPFLPKLASLLV